MLEKKENSLKKQPERAVLVGLVTSDIDRAKAEEYLKKAISFKYNYPIAHYNMGIIYGNFSCLYY